jgi:hypothetical protein
VRRKRDKTPNRAGEGLMNRGEDSRGRAPSSGSHLFRVDDRVSLGSTHASVAVLCGSISGSMVLGRIDLAFDLDPDG